jgi:hypothetical protein
MRGKLRDKRATAKKDGYSSRESIERRRPYKRDARTTLGVDQQNGEEFDIELEFDEIELEGEDNEELEIQVP